MILDKKAAEELRELRKNYPPVNLAGARIRRTRLDRANLSRANFTNADLTGASLVGANFKDTILDGTILKGADLRDAINLTVDQIRAAVIDETTRLPGHITEQLGENGGHAPSDADSGSGI